LANPWQGYGIFGSGTGANTPGGLMSGTEVAAAEGHFTRAMIFWRCRFKGIVVRLHPVAMQAFPVSISAVTGH
jgi:hypothetical protein